MVELETSLFYKIAARHCTRAVLWLVTSYTFIAIIFGSIDDVGRVVAMLEQKKCVFVSTSERQQMPLE